MFKATVSFLLMLSAASHVFAFAPSAVRAAPKTPTHKQPLRMIGSILDLLGGMDKSQLIDPEKALPGRETKMPNIDGYRHYVLGNKLTEVPEGYKEAVFANGCFWGSEKGIWRLPKGIHSTAVGYCAG